VQTEQLLCWSGMTDTTTSGSNEEEESKKLIIWHTGDREVSDQKSPRQTVPH